MSKIIVNTNFLIFQQEIGRLMRRNIMRYMVLSYVITLQRISLRVKRRFPGWQHLVDAGLMLESERKIFEIMDSKSPMSKYWMPLVWATNIINRARKDGIRYLHSFCFCSLHHFSSYFRICLKIHFKNHNLFYLPSVPYIIFVNVINNKMTSWNWRYHFFLIIFER